MKTQPPLGPLVDKALEKASQGAVGTSTQRKSSRAAATADEDSVEKAAKLAAKKEPRGNKCCCSEEYIGFGFGRCCKKKRKDCWC